MSDLRRQLWRYETGLVSRETVEPQLNCEIDALVTRYREGEPLWTSVAKPDRAAHGLCVEFDEKIAVARTALGGGLLRDCWMGIRKADDVLQKLMLTAASARALDEVSAALDVVPPIPESLELTFAKKNSLDSLLAVAKQYQATGDYRTAMHIASACKRELGPPSEELAKPSSAFAQRIRAIRDRYAELANRLDREGTKSLMPAAIPLLDTLILRGLRGIALSLLDDLENVALSCTVYLDQIERQIGHADRESTTQNHIEPKESWPTATARLLEADVARVAEFIRSIDGVQHK